MLYVDRLSSVKWYVEDMQEAGRERTRREEYTEATRQALLAAGRDAFASEGYQAAGIEAISRAARVTRGAFYHHFEDKKALFDAVVVALQIEAAAGIEARAKTQRKVWDRLTEGIDAYLDVCLEQDCRDPLTLLCRQAADRCRAHVGGVLDVEVFMVDFDGAHVVASSRVQPLS